MRILFDPAAGRSPEEGEANRRVATIAASRLVLLLGDGIGIGLVRPGEMSHEDRLGLLGSYDRVLRLERGSAEVRYGVTATAPVGQLAGTIVASLRRESGADFPLRRDGHWRSFRETPALVVCSCRLGLLSPAAEAGAIASAVAAHLARIAPAVVHSRAEVVADA